MGKLIGFMFLASAMILLLVGLSLYTWFVWGYVAYKFYYWYVLPVITTLPTLQYIQIVSLVIFLSVIRHKGTETPVKKEYKEDGGPYFIFNLLAPWIILVVGFIVKTWFF